MKTQIKFSRILSEQDIFSESHNDFRRNQTTMTAALELIGEVFETFEAI